MTTPEQCRMARAALGWSLIDLADKAGISMATVARFERGDARPHALSLQRIRQALEDAGVIFLAPGDVIDGGAGVRLQRAQA